MIWKIEEITDIEQPVPKVIMDNCRRMISSIAPERNVSQKTVFTMMRLLDKAERLLRQGQNREARSKLRNVYKSLQEIEGKRRAKPTDFLTWTDRRKGWKENFLNKKMKEILR